MPGEDEGEAGERRWDLRGLNKREMGDGRWRMADGEVEQQGDVKRRGQQPGGRESFRYQKAGFTRKVRGPHTSLTIGLFPCRRMTVVRCETKKGRGS